MNPKLKRKIKLFIPALIVVPILLVAVLWIIKTFVIPSYKLEVKQAGNHFSKTFLVRQSNGKYAPLVQIYWRQDKPLIADDVIKILEGSQDGYIWTAEDDNTEYTRWRRSDNKLKATHRKKDGRMVLFRKEFADWKSKYGDKNKELIIRVLE